MAEAWQRARTAAGDADRLRRAPPSSDRREVRWKLPAPPRPPRRRGARLSGPLRRRVPGAPVALEDLRQVAARDPALHHRLPASDRRRGAEFIAFFAILFTKRWPRGMFDFTVQIQRWTANVSAYALAAAARRVPAVLRRGRRVSGDARGRLRREPVALADLRQVAAGDPALHRAGVPRRSPRTWWSSSPSSRSCSPGATRAACSTSSSACCAGCIRVQRVRVLADDRPLPAVQPEVGRFHWRLRANDACSLCSAPP